MVLFFGRGTMLWQKEGLCRWVVSEGGAARFDKGCARLSGQRLVSHLLS